MSEKRHWLTRRPEKYGGGYSICHSVKPPHPAQSGGWTYAGQPGEWVEGGVVIPETQTRYGHTLEPGGGPVDVSEWFPEGGKTCDNCAWEHHDGRCMAGPCEDASQWKPREQCVTEYINTDPLRYLGGAYFDIHAPAIPPGEEGGRTMKKYPVEVWTKDGEGDRTGLVKGAPEFMVATSAENARDKVVIAITKLGAGVDDHEIVICTPLA